jgi:hypothetical protein
MEDTYKIKRQNLDEILYGCTRIRNVEAFKNVCTALEGLTVNIIFADYD